MVRKRHRQSHRHKGDVNVGPSGGYADVEVVHAIEPEALHSTEVVEEVLVGLRLSPLLVHCL